VANRRGGQRENKTRVVARLSALAREERNPDGTTTGDKDGTLNSGRNRVRKRGCSPKKVRKTKKNKKTKPKKKKKKKGILPVKKR